MSPYRAIVHRDTKPANGRTLAGRLRSAWRRWLVWRGGTWRTRWVRCETCRLGAIPRWKRQAECLGCERSRFWRDYKRGVAIVPAIPIPPEPFRLPGVPFPLRVPDGETERFKV